MNTGFVLAVHFARSPTSRPGDVVRFAPAWLAFLPFVWGAWSPNPTNPPLYLDLPIGDQAQAVLAKWAANAPLAFIDQYILELKRYRAIAIDVGDQDGSRVDAGKLHDVLDRYGIVNTFEVPLLPEWPPARPRVVLISSRPPCSIFLVAAEGYTKRRRR